MLGGAQAVTNGGFTRYNSIQLIVRRRFANGLQFDVNYTYGNGFDDTRYSFRVPRLFTRDDERRHARAQGQLGVPDAGRPRQALRHRHEPVARRRRRRLDVQRHDAHPERRPLRPRQRPRRRHERRRSAGPVHDAQGRRRDVVYFWPEDVINETIKAFSTSATSPTGYGGLGAAERPLLRAGQRPGLHRDGRQRLRRLRRPLVHRHRSDARSTWTSACGRTSRSAASACSS